MKGLRGKDGFREFCYYSLLYTVHTGVPYSIISWALPLPSTASPFPVALLRNYFPMRYEGSAIFMGVNDQRVYLFDCQVQRAV